MKFTGIIPVKLNSLRVPFKSIREIGGKPLVSRAIATLNQVESISETILYCSDETVRHYVDNDLSYTFVKRPVELDSDQSTFNDVLGPITDEIETDYVVYLSCTSPFLSSETISDMISQIMNNDFDSAFTASRHQIFAWYKGKPLNYDPTDVPRTQEIEPVFIETSGLYIFSRDLFRRYKRRIGFNPYIKEVDVLEGWDIDTERDFDLALRIEEANCGR